MAGSRLSDQILYISTTLCVRLRAIFGLKIKLGWIDPIGAGIKPTENCQWLFVIFRRLINQINQLLFSIGFLMLIQQQQNLRAHTPRFVLSHDNADFARMHFYQGTRRKYAKALQELLDQLFLKVLVTPVIYFLQRSICLLYTSDAADDDRIV